MKVVCISNNGMRTGEFIIGEIWTKNLNISRYKQAHISQIHDQYDTYNVDIFGNPLVSVTNSIVNFIKGENNTEYDWEVVKNHFMKIEEWREEKLNQIGII